MRYAATYNVGRGQYTPNQKRADGMGYESRWIEANSFDEAVVLAKEWYEANPFSFLGNKVSPPTHIILFSHDDPAGRARSFHYDTLEPIR